MINFIKLFIISSLVLLGINNCSDKKQIKEKILISTTVYPIFNIVENIAQERVDIFKILPNGVSAHDFQPTPRDITKISKSDIVFYLGEEFEPWLSSLIQNSSKKVSLSDGIMLLDVKSSHAHFKKDPHFWLSIKYYKIMSKSVLDSLIKVDSVNREFYIKNYKSYIQKIDTLEDNYNQNFKNCVNKTIIVTHNAYSYLAKDYNLHVIAVGSVVDEEEPSAKKLTSILKVINKHKIDTIFYDVFSNNNFSKMVAQELDLKTLYLHPLGNISLEDKNSSRDYISIMTDNLNTISSVLNCK